MKKSVSYFLLALIPMLNYSQNPVSQYGLKLSGFVKSDFFFDTHETVSIREGHFLLYPSRDKFDSQGNIINDNNSFNFLAIQSRLTAHISGPDAFGAKISGMIEADFFGNENTSFSDLNGLRMRHAYVKMNWTRSELLAGQYWHPLFVPGCFPDVISFNTGSPFQPFSRNPQIRYTHTRGKLSMIAALNSQRDFTNIGGSSELRNTGIPDMNLQMHFASKDPKTGREFLAGTGFEHKIVAPRLSSTVGVNVFEVHEQVSSSAYLLFVKFQTNSYFVKLHGIYGQNLTDLVMLGGYAPSVVSDTISGELDYQPISNAAFWFEVGRRLERIDLGLFAGYTQNLGAQAPVRLAGLPTKTRGYDIHNVYRISPRIVFKSGKLRIAAELEYTAAAYAVPEGNSLAINEKAEVTDYKYMTNIRSLLSFIYSF